MKKGFVFGMMVLMLWVCMSISAQNKKSLGLPNKAIKAMEKEGWYVEDGRSLSAVFACFDSLYKHQFSRAIIGFLMGEAGYLQFQKQKKMR